MIFFFFPTEFIFLGTLRPELKIGFSNVALCVLSTGHLMALSTQNNLYSVPRLTDFSLDSLGSRNLCLNPHEGQLTPTNFQKR